MTQIMLIVVEDVFDLGNCLVLAPGIDASLLDTLRKVTAVELVFPDRSSHQVNIFGIEHITPNWQKVYPIAICKSLEKNAIPIGTQVWTIDL